jgi:hypothetical protein
LHIFFSLGVLTENIMYASSVFLQQYATQMRVCYNPNKVKWLYMFLAGCQQTTGT